MAREFHVNRLNAVGMTKAVKLADVFGEALEQIMDLIPAGRELSLVVTKLQEASFFAKRAIATLPENQE